MLTARELAVLSVAHRLTTRQIVWTARVSLSTITDHMKRHGFMRSRKKVGIPKLPALLAAFVG